MIYRGSQVGPDATAEDVAYLQELGANLIRWELAPEPHLQGEGWLVRVLDGAGRLRDIAEKFPKMTFNVSLMKVPVEGRNSLIGKGWSGIRERLLWCANVKFYTLYNEPDTNSHSICNDYMNSGIIGCGPLGRQHNSPKFCLSHPHGDPIHFKAAQPVRTLGSRGWYTFNMWTPLPFTHQGVYPQYPVGVPAPLKDWIRAALKPVRSFQLKHRRKILVGEVGCSNHTAEGDKLSYLKNCIELFEEYGWSWSYHAIGHEDPVWYPTAAVSDLLAHYWGKNHE